MIDKGLGLLGTLIIAGAVVRIFTNTNGRSTLDTAFNGFANDVNAALGPA